MAAVCWIAVFKTSPPFPDPLQTQIQKAFCRSFHISSISKPQFSKALSLQLINFFLMTTSNFLSQLESSFSCVFSSVVTYFFFFFFYITLLMKMTSLLIQWIHPIHFPNYLKVKWLSKQINKSASYQKRIY